VVDDFEAEQASLMDVVAALSGEQWLLPTPASGWDVRDQISHLADTDDIALASIRGGPRNLLEEGARYAEQYGNPDGFTQHQVEMGRTMEPRQVLEWWKEAAEKLRAALLGCDPTERIPWGPNSMSPRSFTTARLMETWAHGLDVRAAVGEPPSETERLRHVAWIVYSARPYAFQVAGRAMPPGDLRVELEAPDGSTWALGPEDADNRITGTALEYCRVGVQRMPLSEATTLKAEGELAHAALEVARAFL